MFVALALVVAIQAAPSSRVGVDVSADVRAEAEVSAVIDRLHATASTADGPAYFDLFTPDARFIGTDVGERWTVAEFKAYAEPYFAKGQGWTYAPRERVISIAPIDCRCVAWFDEVLDNPSYGVVRGSGVLRKTDAGWKIEQYVLSFAIPNDAADEVTGLIRRQAAEAALAGSIAAGPSH